MGELTAIEPRTSSIELPDLPARRRQPVNRFQFQNLVISTLKLVRADLPQEGLVGLLDPETGTWYVIEERELFD